MVRSLTTFAAIAAIGLIAGCGGGGPAPSATQGSQTPVTSGGAPTTQTGKTRAALTLVVQSRKAARQAKVRRAARTGRTRDYIAPTTQGVIAEFAGSDSSSDIAYQGYTLAPGATETATSPASCGATASDGSFTCTLYFALAPSITYATTLTAYDAAQSGTSGAPATGSNALSTGSQSIAITANAANTFAFTLSGIVEGFTISPQYVGVAGTSSGTGTLTGLFQALDADNDPIDEYDGGTSYVYGPQPGGPFVAASFAVAASDENETCAKTACLTTTSTAVTSAPTETVSYAYDGAGEGGNGTASDPPYYGQITLSPPASYGGFDSNGYAASLFIVPFFGFVDASSAYASGTASVAFTASGQSITGFATQYHPPSAAPGDGSGYTVDASSCGSGDSSIASVGTPTYTVGVGIAFPITAGSTSGTCTITLSDDGTATGADTATIDISNTTPGNASSVRKRAAR